jgi:hypothetical protein
MAHSDTRPISFTYPPVVFMWVANLHNLFLYSDPPLTCHPPSCWLRLFSSQTFSRINTPKFSNLVILHTYPPMKMEQCSETLAHNNLTPWNYPEESIQNWMNFARARDQKADIERWNTNVAYAWMKRESVQTETNWFVAAIFLIKGRYLATY